MFLFTYIKRSLHSESILINFCPFEVLVYLLLVVTKFLWLNLNQITSRKQKAKILIYTQFVSFLILWANLNYSKKLNLLLAYWICQCNLANFLFYKIIRDFPDTFFITKGFFSTNSLTQ